jgi:crotonobetainyl-CoA:carnitine CoA-transferase CaiB-like acyl-CoA transferase
MGDALLGALGAEIIKIEWPENERGRLPSSTTPRNLEINLNTSGNFNDTNVNKKSVSLNVRNAKGLEIAKRLVAISDILIENFSSRVLQNWGLGYQELRKIKPDIVYVSMSGYGHTGRHHHYTTFGPVAQAVSGLTFISGLPDQPPAGWGWSYMDDTGGMLRCNVCSRRPLSSQHDRGGPAHRPLSNGDERSPQRPSVVADARHSSVEQSSAGNISERTFGHAVTS